jgi:hypothetical protein
MYSIPMDSSSFLIFVMHLQRQEARKAEVPSAVLRRIQAVREACVEPQLGIHIANDEVSCLMKRSSKMFGERWQKRVFFILEIYGRYTLHYMYLTQESGPPRSSILRMFSQPQEDKTLSIEANSTVWSCPHSSAPLCHGIMH